MKLTLTLLLRDLGDAGERAALALGDLVVSPLLFLGSALLYVDQAARVSSSDSRKRSAGGVKRVARAVGDKLAPPTVKEAACRPI